MHLVVDCDHTQNTFILIGYLEINCSIYIHTYIHT